VHFYPHLCTPRKTSGSVTHPEIAPGQTRLTSEFFAGGLPEKKVYLDGISILSILLSLEPGCHIHMARNDRLVEERHQPIALMQNCAKPCLGEVAFHHEFMIKHQQLEYRQHGQGTVKSPESSLILGTPPKALLAQQSCQRYGDGAVVMNETPVIAGQAEEHAHGAGRLGEWPVQYHVYIMLVHSHACS
jgi:hypothetical protein